MRGFTLIELILVMMILGIAAALALPFAGKTVAVAELSGTSDALAADIRWVQELDVQDEASSYQLRFQTVPPYGYVITQDGTTGIKRVQFPASVAFVTGSTIFFDHNGFVNRGQTVILSSTVVRNCGKKIIIEGAVGRVRVE